MTFKEWYDNQSEAIKSLVVEYPWIDFTQPDYLRKYKFPSVEELTELLQHNGRSYGKTAVYLWALAFLQAQPKDKPWIKKHLHDEIFNLYNKDDLVSFVDTLDDQFKTLYHFEVPTERPGSDYSLEPLMFYYRYHMEDFPKDRISLWDFSSILPAHIEFIGYATVREHCKKNPDLAIRDEIAYNEELFDDLFFSADGWTVQQQEKLVNRLAWSKEGFDFLARKVFSIKPEFIYPALKRRLEDNPREGTNIYRAKDAEGKYKYSDIVRNLALAYRCCKLKQISDQMVIQLGAIGVLIREYDFNFYMIYKQLYPTTNE